MDSFIYWYVVTTSTVGYGDISPSTLLGQSIVALWVIPGGVALFAATIGKAVNDIGERTRMNREGKGQFGRFTDHIIVVCDNNETFRTLDEETNSKLGRTPKVVVTTGISDHHDWVKAGSYHDKEAYFRANYLTCKRIVIMLNDDQSAITAVLSLAKATTKPIIVYLKDESSAELITDHFANVEVVLSNHISLVARSMADPGISSIFEALMCSGRKDTLYGIDAVHEKIAWLDIGEIEKNHDCSVIAIQSKSGTIDFVNNWHDYINPEFTQKVFYISKERIV